MRDQHKTNVLAFQAREVGGVPTFRSKNNNKNEKRRLQLGRIETRQERLLRRSKEIGNRHQRKIRKYSNGFNEKFEFFLKSYRCGLLTFCGVEVIVEKGGYDCKESFRMYDDGQFKNKVIQSRHPNILRCVIIGKKSWGLWLGEWTDGICEWCFTEEEILSQFTKNGIKIPDSFLLDFRNTLEKKKIKRNKKILEEYGIKRN